MKFFGQLEVLPENENYFFFLGVCVWPEAGAGAFLTNFSTNSRELAARFLIIGSFAFWTASSRTFSPFENSEG